MKFWKKPPQGGLSNLSHMARQIADGCVFFVDGVCSTPKSCFFAAPPRKVNSEHGSKVVFMVQTDSGPSSENCPPAAIVWWFFFKAVRNAAFQTALAPRLTLWRCPLFFCRPVAHGFPRTKTMEPLLQTNV